MKIKICGLKDIENITQIIGLSPDYAGFIFYDKSPRNVQDESVIPRGKFQGVRKTGVFVEPDREVALEKCTKFGFDAIQLHGDLHEEDLFFYKKNGLEVIRTLGIDASFNFSSLDSCIGKVDYFLFDTKSKSHGGTGIKFDWSILESYRFDIPFFLSGGIRYEDLDEVLELSKRLPIYGVDMNSGLEISPGFKNVSLVEKSIKKIKAI